MTALPLVARVSFDLTPREISMDDTARLTLRVEGGVSGGSPQLPLPEGLVVRATSRNEVIANRQRETTFLYELQATRPGEFAIGPYTLTLGGGEHTVGPATLTVNPARVVDNAEDVFLRLEASAERVLVHQPVEITVTLFSRYQVDDIQLTEFDAPGLEVGDWQIFQQRDRDINGQRYQVRRFVNRVVPTRGGSLEISPVFAVQVLVPDDDLTRDRFGMLTRRATRRTVRLRPETVRLEVETPPREGRPPDFDGAVGQFLLNVSASPTQVRVGDPVTVRVRLEGVGNLRNILPPSFRESDDFQVFTPRVVEEELSRDGTRGRKVLEQVLVPKHPEVERIPELRFSFFNPSEWKYETRVGGPIALEVEPAPVREPAQLLTGPGTLRLGTGPAILGEDLMYIRTRPSPHAPVSGGVAGFAGWTFLPLLAWAGLGLLVKRKLTLESNPALARRLDAPRKLRKQLDTLDESSQPHEAMWRCLAEYLANRFHVPAGEVEAGRVAPHLEPNLPEDLLEQVVDWLNICERARFSGGIPEANQTETLDRFRAFMLTLNQEAKG